MKKTILLGATAVLSACLAITYGKGIEKLSNLPPRFENGKEVLTPLHTENVNGQKRSASSNVKFKEDESTDSEIVIKTLPYSTDFSEDFEDYATIDANNDGSTWVLNQDGNLIYNFSAFNNADDWLLTPGFEFEAGKLYNLQSTLASQFSFFTNIIEIKMGKAEDNGIDGLTMEIMPKQSITDLTTLSQVITVEETGIYRLGYHVTSDAYSLNLFFYGLSISEGSSTQVPGQDGICTIEPDKDGNLIANINFELPKTDVAGNPVSNIENVEISNITTGQKIGSMTNPPDKITMTDMSPINGENTYEIVCSNSYGKGIPQQAIGYVGIDIPKAPRNVHWDFLNDGITALITWDDSEDRGIHELPIDKESLQYNIYGLFGSSQEILGSNWTSNEFTYKPFIRERQALVGFGVSALTNQGMGQIATQSNFKLCGIPYDVPYFESFAGGTPATTGWVSHRFKGDYTDWTISDTYESINPSDNDMGMLTYVTLNEEAESLVSSPLINLSTTTSPVLSFNYVTQGNGFEFDIVASIDRGESWIKLQNIEPSEEWTNKVVDLSQFKDLNNVIIAFNCETNDSGNIVAVDDIYVGDNFTKDLGILNYSLDNNPHFAGMTTEVKVGVSNNGMDNVDKNWKIEAYCGDRKAGEAEGVAISKGKTASLLINLNTSALDKEKDFTFILIYEEDQNSLNNELSANLDLEDSWLPSPSNLTGTSNETNIEIAWDAPSDEFITPPSFSKTVDFEDYESWSVGDIEAERDQETGKWIVLVDEGMLGDFKIIDGDHLDTYSLSMTGAYPHKFEPMTWTVFNSMDPTDISASHRAHSGNKAILTWSSSNGMTDDWLILPRLGNDKKISFWARSISPYYGLEQIEICISTSGNNKEDFSKFSDIIEVPSIAVTSEENGYTFYEFELPEDTEYAAIHHATNNRMGVLIDDITFTPHSGESKVYEPVSFNIYRNGENIGNVTSSELKYTDATPIKGLNIYNVSALYEEGESKISNTLEINYKTSGINNMTAVNPFTISDGKIFFNLDNVKVYTLEGIYLGEFNHRDAITVPSGVYIIKHQQNVYKVKI